MTRRIKRILAYGCSWTAGSELMDHVHMGVSFDKCNTIKKTYIATGKTHENMHRFIEKYNIDDPALVNLNHCSSWAGQVAGMLNKPLKNRAEGGSSLDQIYFTLYMDFIKGNILDTDLVLVGLTTPYRTVKFRDHVVGSLQLGYHFREGKEEDKSMIELFNDDYLVYTYFKTLQLFGALKDKINIRLQPVIQEVYPHRPETFIFDLKQTRDYACAVWNSLQDVFLLEAEYLQEYIVDGKPKRCGFMHEPVESHTELANKIYNQVKF